jgi:hypothetical protein
MSQHPASRAAQLPEMKTARIEKTKPLPIVEMNATRAAAKAEAMIKTMSGHPRLEQSPAHADRELSSSIVTEA